VLDKHLAGKEFICAKYSIADMCTYGWVNIAYFSGVDLAKFPNVEAWYARVGERPAVKKGMTVPCESTLGNVHHLQNIKDDAEYKKTYDEAMSHVDAAKKQYGYVYSSP
jgi:glutathione S-transferase